MLDLGTGQGFHAMVAAGHCGRIIATDVNPRALTFARWGIEANAIDNVDLRQGSLFEPVASEAPFDLIVSNPPFIISPTHALVCLGGEAEGGGSMRRSSAG
jgi:methylase of polypeptide subunit release factors